MLGVGRRGAPELGLTLLEMRFLMVFPIYLCVTHLCVCACAHVGVRR